METVIAVLAASRDGASINAAAKASGINYRTAQRIVEAAAEQRQRQLVWSADGPPAKPAFGVLTYWSSGSLRPAQWDRSMTDH
jgi:molybdenum-dependent DNA-binding transcriptional regulator ModE